MSAVLYNKLGGKVYLGAYVGILVGNLGKRAVNVKLGYHCRRFHNALGVFRNPLAKHCENLELKRYELFVSAENAAFHFLKLLCDIALAVRKRLLSYVSVGNVIYKGFRHLYVIAEHLVVVNLKRSDARNVTLTLLD